MRPNLSFADVQFRHQMKERFSIMKNNITELVFILDRSGSMSGLEGDTIGGFNSMIEKQKKQDGGCYVSTVLFDDESEVLHDRVKLTDIPKMTDEDYTVARRLLMLLEVRFITLVTSISMPVPKMYRSIRCLLLRPTVRKTQVIVTAVSRLKR